MAFKGVSGSHYLFKIPSNPKTKRIKKYDGVKLNVLNNLVGNVRYT